MGRPGRVNFVTREKAVTNDIVRLQDMLGQDLMELARGMAGVHPNPNGATPEDRNVVFRGLAVVPGTGMSPEVQPGYGAIARALGAPSIDQSSYQLVRQDDQAILPALAAADPINPRIDLIEVESGDDSEPAVNRDQYNPVTGTFAPVPVIKVTRAGAVYTVTPGVAAANPVCPAFSVAALDRMPLAAVRVPAGATALTANDIIDLRPLWVPGPLNRMHGVKQGLILAPTSPAVDFATFQMRAGIAVVDGQLVRRTATTPLTLADHVDPTVVLAPNTWYYCYLFAGRDAIGYRARHTVIDSPTREGFVVITDVPPNSDGYPSGVVDFPVNYAGGHVYGGSSSRGMYLGAIRTGAVATDVSPFQRDGDWIHRNEVFANFVAPASPSTTTVSLGAAGLLPANCLAVKINILCMFASDLGGATSLHILRLRTLASTVYNVTLRHFRPIAVAGQVDALVGGVAVVPLPVGVPSFDVYLETVGAPDRWNGALQQFGVHGIFDPIPRAQG